MGRVIFLAVLTLLYLQWGESALLLPSGKEYVFVYTGVVTAKSSASDHHASQWTVDAYLRLQVKGSDIAMKFDEIRTSLFNGDLHNLQDNIAKPIPTEASQLALPFVVHYNEKNGSALSISYQTDDPLWSLNIKKAIASIFQLDGQAENYISGTKHYEDGIYGKCEAKYSIVEDNSFLNILKTIEDGSCVNELENNWGNMERAPIMAKDFKPLTSVAERTYRFIKQQSDSAYALITIESNATIAYQTMSNELSNLQIIQGQVFHAIYEHKIIQPFNVTKNTETTSLVFEFDESDESSGRTPKFETDSSQIISDIRETYEQFTEEFNKYPLTRGVNNTLMYLMNIINSMADIKEKMDLKTFNVLMDKNEPAGKMFISLLPYIGTNDTMQMIKDIIAGDQLSYFQTVKLLATCPKYVRGYTLELLDKMEALMNPKNIRLRGVQHLALMSFAAMVSEANKQADVPASQLEKFHKKYAQLFKDSEDYDDKITYLSGLINMGSLLDTNTMISIITDDKESHFIRSLAAYGFKPYLASNPEQMFKKLWSVVQNRTEHYEVRTAVLDLLMASDLTQTEFDTIIKEFKEETDDLYERSLQNYLATTLKSLSNTTMFPDYLGTKVADVVDLIPSHYDSWTTGNYRLSYTDPAPNFGGYFQARLVSNPVTRGLNIIQLTSSQFAISKSLGTYTAYIKLEGFAESTFLRRLTARSNRKIPVPELLEILKEFNYKLVEKNDVHIQIILFCDDRIVYEVSMDKMDMRRMFHSPQTRVKLFLEHESVTFPKMYFGNMASDLGTHVQTYVVETDINSYEWKIDDDQFTDNSILVKTTNLKFRSSNHDMISLFAYNPLADVKIGVYKHKTYGKRVHLPIAFNTTADSIIIENHSDSLNLLSDKTIGTTVHSSEKLETYCSTCEVDMELPLNDPEQKRSKLEEFGTILHNTIIAGEKNLNLINNKLIDSYRGNAEAIQIAEPLVMFWYLLDYYRYLGPERGSFESRTVSLYKEPTEIVIQPFLDDESFDNDLINGTELLMDAIITCRRKSDGKVLSVLDVGYKYMSAVPTDERTAITQVKNQHLFRANFTQQTNVYVMCFDREVKYPNRRPDLLSISPYEPARGKGSFSYGTSTDAGTCPDEISFTFTDIAETAQHVMEKVKNMKEYKTCKKDTDGFKYIPPTDACSTVHDAVSMYTNYTLYLNLKKLGALGEKLHDRIPNSDDGFKFLESNYISKDTIHFKVSKEFLDTGLVTLPDNNDILDTNVSVGSYRGSYDPTIVAYQGYGVESGVSATCNITPSKISTFTGKEIENYGTKDDKEIVAYVECLKEPFSGMTIQRYSDKKIGFNFWTGNYTLVTSMSGDKLKVVLSGEELHDHYKNTNLRIYFLAEDVLYITDTVIEVYYNTEFITIKSSARINNFICGLCASEDRRITGNEVK